MSKKFELTDETVKHDGHTLHRIVALKDFGDVKTGDKGGWVESENNLSQEGNCWVYGEAKVYGKARVYNNALVYDRAQVYGEAHIYDHARVHGKAKVCDNALVTGLAVVYNNALVHGDVQVYGDARVCGEAEVRGNARVCASVNVKADAILRTGMTKSDYDYVVVGPQGSRRSYATYHIPSNTVSTGCFDGTLNEFEFAVEETHKDNPKYLEQYKRVIKIFNMYKR